MELAGDYFCSQGWTRMKVLINRVEPIVHKHPKYDARGTRFRRVLATLDFLTTEGVEGSFIWQGTWNLDTNVLDVKPERWLDQPEYFAMVAVVGVVSRVLTDPVNGVWSTVVSGSVA